MPSDVALSLSLSLNKVYIILPLLFLLGPKPVLSSEEETRLADWAIQMAKIGYGRTKQELLDTVQKILNADGRPNPFTNNRPGKDWYQAFMKRHPELSQRQQQQLGKERAVISSVRVEEWFNDFKSYMDSEVEDQTIWSDSRRWYNADESGFPLCPKGGRVLAMKGSPNVYQLTSSDKIQITVLACMNASGDFVQPANILFRWAEIFLQSIRRIRRCSHGEKRNGMDGLRTIQDMAFGRFCKTSK